MKNKQALGFIFFTLLIDVIGFGIIIPVLPSLLAGMIGGSIADASKDGLVNVLFCRNAIFLCAVIGGFE